jgi:hypothetical protein
MKKICFLLIALSTIFCVNASSYTVTGKVFYVENGVETYVPNAQVNVGDATVTTGEDGSYAIEVEAGENVTFKIKCPYSSSLVAPKDYVVSVGEDTTANFQVVKGEQKQAEVSTIFLSENFDGWDGSDGSSITSITLPQGWESFSDGTNVVSISTTYAYGGSGKCLRGTYNNTHPMVIFPVKGDDDYGVDISFDVMRGSSSFFGWITSATTEKLDLCPMTKTENGFTGDQDVTVYSWSPENDFPSTSEYTSLSVHLDSSVVDGSDNQYLAFDLSGYNCLDNLVVSYKECWVEPITETITGTITSGETTVEGATVTLEGQIDGNDYNYTTTTNPDGSYSIGDVLSNLDYSVSVSGPTLGYTDSGDTLYVDSSEPTTYDADLDYSNNSDINCVVVLHSGSGAKTAVADANEEVKLEFYHNGDEIEDKIVTVGEDDTVTFTVDGEYAPAECAIRASVDGYYQTLVADSADEDGIQAADVDKVISVVDGVKTIYIHLQKQETKHTFEGGTLGRKDGVTAYFQIKFDNHKLHLNSSSDIVTLSVNGGNAKSASGLRTATTWSPTNVPMKIQEDGEGGLYVYKDMELAWSFELATPNTFTLTIPEGMVNIDDYEYDHDLTYEQEFGVETGVMSVAADANALVDVYTPSGVCIKSGISRSDLDVLPSGMYIVKSGSYVYKLLK